MMMMMIMFIMTTRNHIPEESDLNIGLHVVKTNKLAVSPITETQQTGEGSMLQLDK
jgi:hypothetical protein